LPAAFRFKASEVSIRRDPFVIHSVSQASPEFLGISAVTMGELLFGLASFGGIVLDI
jgi:hypothetical protein